jgi:hypothetical protein
MNFSKSPAKQLPKSLVLSLQRDLHMRNYYLSTEKNRRQLIFMEEYSACENPEHYTVFNSWEDALKDMNKFESSIAGDKRWWSFCPGWMYFDPAFIHQGLKHIFGKLLVQSLDDVQQSDVVLEEKERFSIWAQSCDVSSEANVLN